MSAALVLAAATVAAQASIDLADVLSRAGLRVEQYYRRAESIVCLEKVTVQPLVGAFTANGFARVLEYEVRVTWEAAPDGQIPDATVTRELKRVNGRIAKPGDQPKCMDPRAISPEPLAFMLRSRRSDYIFAYAGSERDRKQPMMVLSYQTRADERAEQLATTKDDCSSFSVPDAFKGRVWLDPDTLDVRRVDQSTKRPFDVRVPYERGNFQTGTSFTIDRYNVSTRYRPVVFRDPDETVLLPESIEMLMLVRGNARSGNRTTQTYSDYKRFITGGRIVK